MIDQIEAARSELDTYTFLKKHEDGMSLYNLDVIILNLNIQFYFILSCHSESLGIDQSRGVCSDGARARVTSALPAVAQ